MEAHDCNFDNPYFGFCVNDRCSLHRAMRKLAANLRIGAALCESFRLGRSWELIFRCSPGHATKRKLRAERDSWSPGCGRSAP